MSASDAPKTAPSGIHKSALDLALEENRRLRARAREEAPPQSMAARTMRAVTGTRTGQLGALAGAIAVVMVPCASIVTAWMDVTKLRAELATEVTARAALQTRVDSSEAWQRDVLGPWRNSVDAYRTAEAGRDAWRDRVLCRTGNKPSWELGWTCPVPARLAGLRE